MVFSSAIFLFAFLPAAVLGNAVIRREYRNIWIIICSIIFYAWSQPQFLWLIAGIIATDYICALLIGKEIKPGFVLATAVILNLSGLLYFKYSNFAIEIINSLTRRDIDLLELSLPIGISFYTFKAISYIADVYRKKIRPERNIIKLSAYILMFPQIMSGPIDPYEKLRPGLTDNQITSELIYDGIKRFIFGLTQKMLFANTLGVIVDDIWSKGAGSLSWKVAWLGSISYTLQIYFDFAGYSNMAIGIGKMLGFHFSENFDLPYMSKSVTEFWRRWHITLGEWFKKYVYIPLGGNRQSAARGYFNLAVVFLLTGIWHGAAWTFVLWGILHGVFRIAEKVLWNRNINIRIPHVVGNILKHAYLLFVVNIAWVLFRAPDINSALLFLRAMSGRMSAAYCGISVREYLGKWNILVLVLAVLFSTSLPQTITGGIRKRMDHRAYSVLRDICLLFMFLLSATEIVTSTYRSFIYFQF